MPAFIRLDSRHAYLEHNLSEVFLVELSEFSETKFTKVREEDSSFLLHLALHIHTLLLRGGQTQGLHGGQQVLNIATLTILFAGIPSSIHPHHINLS